jgi:hypothetical protein
MKDITSTKIEADRVEVASVAKPKWEKPEIVDFKPITVARGGGGPNPGDGVSNLT